MEKRKTKRIIAHIDMNSYFASVEQQARPFLRNRPIGVTGPSKRTIIIAASVEAKKFGVKTGTQIADAKKLCPQIVLVTSDCTQYEAISKNLIEIFTRFTPKFEVFSIDEAFLDFSDCNNFKEAEDIVKTIKQQIKDEIGANIRCSAGIASNKFMAKLASEAKKPDGLTVVLPGKEISFLDQFELEDACGIGLRIHAHLNRLGVYSFKDLRELDQTKLTLIFNSYGLKLYNMARGIDYNPVVPYFLESEVKSISRSKTLPGDIFDKSYLRKVLLFFCQDVAQELKRKNLLCSSLGVYVRFNDFTHSGLGRRIKSPTELSKNLSYHSNRILDQIELKKPVRKIGVWAGALKKDNGQLTLSGDFSKQLDLEKAAEGLNRKYSRYAVFPSVLTNFKISKSPSYGFKKKFED